jgi:hypothetical protein
MVVLHEQWKMALPLAIISVQSKYIDNLKHLKELLRYNRNIHG